jgi:hypothetical protein
MTPGDYFQLALETLGILAILGIVFALVWGTKAPEPTPHSCSICNRAFEGPNALEQAEICEAEHLINGGQP